VTCPRMTTQTAEISDGAPSQPGASPANPRIGRDVRSATPPQSLDAIDLDMLGDCNGDYTCECLIHTLEREQRVRRGVGHPRNPWEPRRASTTGHPVTSAADTPRVGWVGRNLRPIAAATAQWNISPPGLKGAHA
jgi:hypothetical protein